MPTNSEIEVIRAVDEALSALEDAGARDRVLHWAWEKFASKPMPNPTRGASESSRTVSKPKKESLPKGPAGKAKGKSKSSPSIVRDLNLKPNGKRSFDAFANEKNPGSNPQKCAVAVYYLRNELELDEVNADHVYTCFKHMKWRVPSDLRNALQVTASVNGWLDTGNMSEIRMTTIGDNFVEHDLPAAVKGK